MRLRHIALIALLSVLLVAGMPAVNGFAGGFTLNLLVFFEIIFLASLALLKAAEWIAARKKFVSIDYVKKNVFLPRSVGIALLLPLWLAGVFLLGAGIDVIAWLALMSVFSFIGFLDDSKSKWTHATLPWALRAVPIGLASLAFAWIYSPAILWVAPLALFIAGLASFHNTFAGLNGWETGSSFIISIALLFLLKDASLIAAGVALSACILALLLFNAFPARVFPGDAGTLLIGSGIGGLVVLSKDINLALVVLLLYLPHLIDYFVLKKLLSKAKDATQQKTMPYKLLDDGRLSIPDYPEGKIQWDFTKMIIRVLGPLKEWQIVLIIWLAVALNALWVVYFFA